MDANMMQHILSEHTATMLPRLSPLPGLHPPPAPPFSPSLPPPSPLSTTDGDRTTYEYILYLTPSLTVAQENAAIAGIRNMLAQAGVEDVLVEAEENETDGKFWVVTTGVQIFATDMGRVKEVRGVENFEISDGLEGII